MSVRAFLRNLTIEPAACVKNIYHHHLGRREHPIVLVLRGKVNSLPLLRKLELQKKNSNVLLLLNIRTSGSEAFKFRLNGTTSFPDSQS
jgi:hypothetical protein